MKEAVYISATITNTKHLVCVCSENGRKYQKKIGRIPDTKTEKETEITEKSRNSYNFWYLPDQSGETRRQMQQITLLLSMWHNYRVKR